MSTPSFCYLGGPEKGLATLEYEGTRFVPLFVRTEDLVGFCNRRREQLGGYNLHLVTDAAKARRFLALLSDLGLEVGLSDAAREAGTAETSFAVLKPEVLARAFGDEVPESVGPGVGRVADQGPPHNRRA